MRLEELIGKLVAVPSTSGDIDIFGRILSHGYAGYLRFAPPLNVDYKIDFPTPNDNEIVYVDLRLNGFPAVDMEVRFPEANFYLTIGNSGLEAGGGVRLWIRGGVKPVVKVVSYSDPPPVYYLEARMWKLIIRREEPKEVGEILVVPFPSADIAAQAVSKLLDRGFKVKLLTLEG